MTDHSSFGKGLTGRDLDQLCVNTIRTLAVDAVQKANSGHPGLPMGCADFAYVLWTRYLRHNPANPQWPDRDRFVLSAGHGSTLLYALLHLCGYPLTLEDLRQFRQWESRTPGHPEFDPALGVETTTGPLGQGAGNAVGMAIAEEHLAARFNTPQHRVVNHTTWVILGDGCNQEGVAHEAISLAGHLGLGKLVFFYDYNHITIEGRTELAYSDDVPARYRALGWHVQEIDGHDRDACARAIEAAQAVADRPSLILGTTTIGFGSPNKAGTNAVHGEPLGADEVKATKKNLGWPEDAQFLVPDAVRARFDEVRRRGAEAEAAWNTLFAAWRHAHPERAALWDAHWNRTLPADLPSKLPTADLAKPVATRSSGGDALKALMAAVPQILGGAADLHPSTKTYIKEHGSFSKANRAARNLHFGIREHAMGAILNGIACHGGLIPFGSTFFVFADYLRPAIRMAAIGRLPVIYVFTHDSIFVGEDGPTHEPVEQAASLRVMPNVTVIRPADASETGWAWIAALQNVRGPTAILLTRQNLPVLDRAKYPSAENLLRGGYVLQETPGAKLTLIGTGSEVALALAAAEKLKAAGVPARVVNLPSWELFEQQPPEYRERVLGKLPRAAIEAGVRTGWERYLGAYGLFLGMDRYGASAPYSVLAEKFGFTPDAVAARVRAWLG